MSTDFENNNLNHETINSLYEKTFLNDTPDELVSKPKKNVGPIIALVTAILLIIVLCLVVGIKVFNAVNEKISNVRISQQLDNIKEELIEEFDDEDSIVPELDEDVIEESSDFDKQIDEMMKGVQDAGTGGEMYYELENYIVDDLSYQVSFEKYEPKIKSEYLNIYIEYPVFSGDIENEDLVVSAAQIEATAWIDILENGLAKQMVENKMNLDVVIKPYITYMDENVLSIVCSEKYSYGSEVDTILNCINIDMQSGFSMRNNRILDIDKQFATDFLEKSEKQNGSTPVSYYDVNQVYEDLNNEDLLIIFYTPLGIEIGINIPNGWVTVTYTDYQQYLNSY